MKQIVLLAVIFILSWPIMANDNADEFVVAFPSRYIEFDPQLAFSTTEAQIFTALYEGLVSFEPQTLRPIPALAEHWDLSADLKTYTFIIRDNLLFSDGSRLTALSFYRSFLRLLDPNIVKPYASNLDIIVGAEAYRKGKGTVHDLGIKALDEHTLEITLNHPAPYFLSILTHFSLSPLSTAQKPGLWDSPKKIGYSGPYIVKEITTNELILVKNPLYWDKDNVQMATLKLQFTSDPAQVSNDFNQYKVDWAIAGSFDSNLVTIKNSLRISAQFNTTYFFFASNQKAFQNPLVRIALIQALPLTTIRSNYTVKAESLIPPITNFPKNIGIKENLEEAKRTLKKAGHENGKGLPPVTIAVPYAGEITSQLIKESWEKLGLTVDIIVPKDDYFTYLEKNHPTLGIMSWLGDYLDPYTFLSMWRTGSPLNFSPFADKAYDGLLNASNFQNGNERFKTLGDAEALLLGSGVVIPMEHTPSVNLIDLQSVDNWVDNPLDLHPFKYLRFKRTIVPGFTAT